MPVFDRTDIARMRESFGVAHDARVMIGKDMICDLDRSVAGIYLIFGLEQVLFQCRTVRHDLKHRTRRID